MAPKQFNLSRMITKSEAECFVRLELKQWGLSEINFKWINVNGINGWADILGKELGLNETLLSRGIGVFIEVVRHEIAHFLDFKERDSLFLEHPCDGGHGPNWKKWCKTLKIPARTHV